MTKANWKEAPEGAETYEKKNGIEVAKFCKPGYWWRGHSKDWVEKVPSGRWTILEHRPRIIAWKDMKEGMVVRCVEADTDGYKVYKVGEEYPVEMSSAPAVVGPCADNYGVAAYLERYTFELVSEPEQRKTVKDAVEFFGGKWPFGDADEMYTTGPSWDGPDEYKGTYKSSAENLCIGDDSWLLVCTREEFEACVAKREPEWTHTYASDNCYIKVPEPDYEGYIVICSEVDGYMLVNPGEIEPIKPTITKAEAEERLGCCIKD